MIRASIGGPQTQVLTAPFSAVIWAIKLSIPRLLDGWYNYLMRLKKN
jgi:hypothetical protein